MKKLTLAAFIFFLGLQSLGAQPALTNIGCTGSAAVDTAALNTALANASAAPGGTVLYHGPCGVQAPGITTYAGVSFRGDGPDNAWLLANATNFNVVTCAPAGVNLNDGVRMVRGKTATCDVRDMTIQCPFVDTTGNYGVAMYPTGTPYGSPPTLGITQPILRNVHVLNCSRGTYVQDPIGGYVENNVIMGFSDIGMATRAPNTVDGGGLFVSKNSITNYQSTSNCANATGTGYYSETGAGQDFIDNHIACVNRGAYWALVGSSSQLRVSRNDCDTAPDSCFFIDAVVPGITFEGVKIKDNSCASPVCVYLANTLDYVWGRDVEVTGNKGAYGVAHSMIFVGGVTLYRVSGNILDNRGSSPATFVNVSALAGVGQVGPNLTSGPGGCAFGSATVITPGC